MEGDNVIYAAERFKQRGKQPVDIELDTVAPVYYIDECREERIGAIVDIVNESTAIFFEILELHGYDKEAIEVREQAHQLAREGAPTEIIYEIFDQYLKDKHPELYKSYRL